jgi:histidinol-phosphatase (PHP family)
MCRAAFAKGFAALGFSSHAPLPKKTGLHSAWHMKEEKLPAYLDDVLAARRRWEGRLAVYLGLEVDFIAGLTGPSDPGYRNMGLDYIIGSVHYAVPPRGRAPFTVDGSREELEKGIREGFGGDGNALAAWYWDALAAMIRAGGFEIIGHADILKKYNQDGKLFDMEGEFWRSGVEAAAEAAGDKVREAAAGNTVAKPPPVLEVNTGGINRKKTREPYPSVSVLRCFREQGVSAVITADAHSAAELGGHYARARQSLLGAGYAEHRLFMGRKNNAAVWAPEKLPTERKRKKNRQPHEPSRTSGITKDPRKSPRRRRRSRLISSAVPLFFCGRTF